MTEEAYPDALAFGHRLHWYVLEHVLGQGGFGITYLARDTNLDRRVAIKEYLPCDIARRRSDASARPSTESQAERYAWGLERFLSEARTLARFDHPNIVRVHSVFEANNTAYMVMRFEEGEALSTLLERRGTLPEEQLLGWLMPILDGLQLVHESGFIHRDIKPENIYVRQDGSPVLLDFGSARQSFGSTKTMTILVAPGYAPLEQYYGDAETQGPWTDIYSLGATCYRAITGKAPVDAIVRAKGVLGSVREVLQSAVEAGRGRYSEQLLQAVDHALQLNDRDRPQRIADWRVEIAAPSVSPMHRTSIPVASSPVSDVTRSSPSRGAELHAALPMHRSPLVRKLLVMAAGLAAASWFVVNALSSAPAPAVPAQATATAQPEASIATVSVALPVAVPVAAQDGHPQEMPATRGAQPTAPKSVAILPRVAYLPNEREARAPLRPSGGASVSPSPSPSAAPAALVTAKVSVEPVPPLATVAPSATTPSPGSAATGSVVAPAVVHDNPAPHKVRDDQLDSADAALRRGDAAAAAEILAPWAAAGVPRAQAMLGRVHEGRSGAQQSDFEAYVWYSMAARAGEPGAQALRDKVALRLQPAEIRQADKLVDRWKPRAEPTASVSR